MIALYGLRIDCSLTIFESEWTSEERPAWVSWLHRLIPDFIFAFLSLSLFQVSPVLTQV